MEPTLEFIAGRLLCGRIRNFLNETKFKTGAIDFYESPGIFERTFIVRGDADLLKSIRFSLATWAKEKD